MTRRYPERMNLGPSGSMRNVWWRLAMFEGVVMTKPITRDELKQKIDRKDNFVLIEILPAMTYHHAHLPGAINLPPDRVTSDAMKVIPNKSADIVVYCASPT